ncbi:MAG: dihydroneopterin aldolase [Verrucomicrobia bacterium]|nr:dihydroneopterin aldolase [Verrucomicrobiota bacterium]
MDTILISDLEVHFRVGVTESERARPQRLLVSVEMDLDVRRATSSDDLAETIDYEAVCARLRSFGDGVHWSLIETLAEEAAAVILEEFRPRRVTVEVKKFVIPQTRHVAVRITRPR